MVDQVRLLDSLNAASSFLEDFFKKRETWEDFQVTFGYSDEWITSYVGYYLSDGFFNEALLIKAGEIVVSKQRQNGGWGYNIDIPPDADTTAFCSLFLDKWNLLNYEQKTRSIKFLKFHQHSDGGFSTYNDPNQLRAIWGYDASVSFRGWCSLLNSVTASNIKALIKLGVANNDSIILKAFDFLRSRQLQNGLWASYWWSDPMY